LDVLLVGANLACNLPGKEASEDKGTDEIGAQTLVAQTLAARITDTPIPSKTPKPTPTQTEIPGGVITGRVYLMDKDEVVRTNVLLIQDKKEIDSTRTDENGNYTFIVEEAGKYSIRVSVMHLIDRCDNLRTLSGWPIVVRKSRSGDHIWLTGRGTLGADRPQRGREIHHYQNANRHPLPHRW